MIKTIDRLMQFIEYVGISARQFDLSIGAGNGYVLRMKKNKASIGSDVIETIVEHYPQLNLIWLITGEGEMLNEEPELLEFNDLPIEKQKEIEDLIEAKIKERQKEERDKLLKEVTKEMSKKKTK